ncbi:MAG: 50S ribosomal protein L4 [Thermoanaerobaculia bacterium]
MKIAVKNLQNGTVGEVELPEAVFAYPYKEHLIHLAVEAYRASQRSGTHKAKGRGEVSGAGKKLWKQKGTGRARMGSLRSPLWRKGGIVHGPVPRSYDKSLSVQEKKNALKSALSKKLAEQQILVIDNLELGNHKAKDLALVLSGLGAGPKALLVDSQENYNLTLASRNNPSLKMVDALGVNVYDVVDRTFVVLSQTALSRLVEVLAR